ncbi:helix-turn-helix domain-containing protein [Microbacterium enclense]|uniref:helix-turn-helix domain-containing protein n=1 Tax=Microbacterium enclense TaxID=993073 RepID=UPI00343236B3
MVARKIQPEDRAALLFIQERQAELGLSRMQLATRAGIPYQTVRGWWDQGKASLSLADVKRLLLAVEVDPEEGVQRIFRLALTLEDTAD